MDETLYGYFMVENLSIAPFSEFWMKMSANKNTLPISLEVGLDENRAQTPIIGMGIVVH